MILAEIEWQGGSFDPIDEVLRALWREAKDARTMVMAEDTGEAMVRHAAKAGWRGDPFPVISLLIHRDKRLPFGLRHPVNGDLVCILIAAAAGNGQILFSDVPAREGMRLVEFR